MIPKRFSGYGRFPNILSMFAKGPGSLITCPLMCLLCFKGKSAQFITFFHTKILHQIIFFSSNFLFRIVLSTMCRSSIMREPFFRWKLLKLITSSFVKEFVRTGCFFNCPPPEFAKCWLVSNRFRKNVKSPRLAPPPYDRKNPSVWGPQCDHHTFKI